MDTQLKISLSIPKEHIRLPYSIKSHISLPWKSDVLHINLGVSNFPLFLEDEIEKLIAIVDDEILFHMVVQMLVVDADPLLIADMDEKSLTDLNIKEIRDICGL